MLSELQHFDPRLKVLFQIFAELERAGVEFALIHGDDNEWPSVSSDVDMAFGVPPPCAIEPVLRQMSAKGTVSIVQRLHYDVPHAYYYILQLPSAPNLFLHLDCLYDPIGINKYRLPTPMLLKDAALGEFGRHSTQPQKAVYLLLKRATKGNISAHALAALRTQFIGAADELWSEVEDWFGPQARGDVERLLKSADPAQANPQLAALWSKSKKRFRRQHPLRFLRGLTLDIWRKTCRFFQPTGLFIVLVGPDGSGKSTIAGALLVQLERAFRRTWRFHWRPGFLPKPGQSSNETSPPDTTPAEVSKYRGAVSLLRFIYYWLDFVIGYWLIIYPKKAQTTLIVGERYFPDILVHPQRYGFDVPQWLMRAAAKFVPSPDLLVLLKDEPEIIYKRKSELSPETIAKQIAAYERELPHWGRAAVIQTCGGVNSVCTQISDLISRECARRTAGRLQAGVGAAPWRAFPSTKNIRIWVHDRETPRNSLDLYQPYLRSRKWAKFAIDRLPNSLRRLIFRDRPNLETSYRLHHLTHVIQHVWGDQNLVVSFLSGTPGPHQKLTAQVSRDDKIIGYVKIGQNKMVGALLQHEAETLGWLQTYPAISPFIPTVRAFQRDNEDALLFLSSPLSYAVKRSHQADEKDVNFLTGLALLGTSKVNPREILDEAGLDTYLDFLRKDDATKALTVSQGMKFVEKHFAQHDMTATPSHGDYAPWNTLETDDGRLFVIDWEYARRRAPALNDLCHRLFTPARYVQRLQPRQLVDHLFTLLAQPGLGQAISKIGIATADVPVYALVYFLSQLAGRRQGAEEDEFLLQSIEYVLERTSHHAARPKVLVNAYACEPGRGSEPGVGWRMCEAISRECEAWIITRKNNRLAIEREMARNPHPHMHFRYVDLPPWARFWKKGERGIRIYYYLWQFVAWWEARKLMRNVKFDIAQHVTFVNDYMGTFLALLPIPFIWGPIGSPGKRPGQVWNSFFKRIVERREFYFKNCVRALDPLLWLSAIRAKLVIGINNEISTRFPISVLTKHKYISHTAIGVERTLVATDAKSDYHDAEFRVVSVGRLMRLKGFEMTVRAFEKLARNNPKSRLIIVGDGPLRESLEQLTVDLRIADKVEFVGLVPRTEALSLMRRGHVFLFPSFEAEGMVVPEALAQGLPVVCLNYGGPGKMITAACGFAVGVDSQDRMIEKLGDALVVLANDQDLWRRMSDAARHHVAEHYLWENRHLTIRKWYAMAGVEVTAKVTSEN